MKINNTKIIEMLSVLTPKTRLHIKNGADGYNIYPAYIFSEPYRDAIYYNEDSMVSKIERLPDITSIKLIKRRYK